MGNKLVVAFLLLAAMGVGAGVPGIAGASLQSVVIVDGAGVYNLFQGSDLEALQNIDDQVGYLGHDTLLPSVTEYAPTVRTTDFGALKNYDVALWYFENERALSKMGSGQLEYITAAGMQGAVIGLGGGDDLLKSVMGAEDSQNDIEPDGDNYYVYLFNATEDGIRDDNFTSFDSDATLGRAWTNLLNWVGGQLSGASVSQSSSLAGSVPAEATLSDKYTSSSDTYDPWLASYNAKISDVGNSGDVAVTISVFKLDTTSETHDWYRVDLNVQGSTYDYYDWWVSVGNYLYSVSSQLYATSGSSYGELWEHAPETTQTNTTVSYDLGVDLKAEVGKDPKTGADVSVGYSKSYDCAEVTIYDHSSHATDKCEWSAEVRGPDWTWWPIDYAPSATAQSSYTYEPSTIWRVGKGNSLKLYTQGTTELAYETLIVLVVYGEAWSEAGTGASIKVKD